MQDQFILEKKIWTQNDIEQMSWHDCRIYGLIFLPDDESWSKALAFDIDYVFKWVRPIPPNRSLSFWVAPCTLVFRDTFDLDLSINNRGGATDFPEIMDIFLVDKVEQETNKWVYQWTIELQEGSIRFKSSGFSQIVRQPPVFSTQQILTPDQRKGMSFDLAPY